MNISRRNFIRSTQASLACIATSAAFSGFGNMAQAHQVNTKPDEETYLNQVQGYGPLIRDPNNFIDLPQGFSYKLFSKVGETMSDGLLVPGHHDGMAAFYMGKDRVALVRNHELVHTWRDESPVGAKGELLSKLDRSKVYDFTPDGFPLAGGTTTLIYNIKTQQLEDHFLSLTGTSTNCSGGTTPWGSWLSCEETTQDKGNGVGKDHGYVFEVPSSYKGLVTPQPIKPMGRFKHEAVCIDTRTGIAYQTEDMFDSVFYRYLPNDKRYLNKGGQLQALVIKSQKKADTTNRFKHFWSQGDSFDVEWVNLDNVDTPDDSLRTRAYLKGAARFARAEGIFFGKGEMYFCCTSGGTTENGQIMRYIPSPYEGQSGESDHPGKLELFVESKDDRVFDYGDNITVSPWGHIYVCEDRYSQDLKNHMRIVTADAKVTTFARNSDKLNSEWAGACFSPDGSTLFANLQENGVSVAITGPWARFNPHPIGS